MTFVAAKVVFFSITDKRRGAIRHSLMPQANAISPIPHSNHYHSAIYDAHQLFHGNDIGVDPDSFLMRISLNKRTFSSAKPISRKILKIRVNWSDSCNSPRRVWADNYIIAFFTIH